MRKTSRAVLLCATYLLLNGPVSAQGDATRDVLERAANALGGLDRIEDIENIALYGYGQYAYQFGGGNITSSKFASM